MLPNFKAVGTIEAEIHILKVKKLDACIRPLFANLVTYVMHRSCFHFYSMQNSSCLQWHLKDENYESDNENCTNALLKYEDLNAQYNIKYQVCA